MGMRNPVAAHRLQLLLSFALLAALTAGGVALAFAWLAGLALAAAVALTLCAAGAFAFLLAEPLGLPARQLDEALAALVDLERRLADFDMELAARLNDRTLSLTDTLAHLRRMHERLAQALEASRIVIWEADAATGNVWLNGEWARMLGAAPGETAATFRELIRRVPKAGRRKVFATLSKVFGGHLARFDIEIALARDDGSLFWIRSRGKITLRDAAGRALRMSGTHSDITRRKLAEDELRESEAKLRLVTDNLPVMINFLDREGRYLFVNRPYLDFLGVPDASVVGKRLADVAGEEAEEIALSHLPELEAGRLVTYARVRTDRLGRRRFFEIRQVPHLGADGGLLAFYSLIEDVTERDEARRALAASEAQLRHLTDSLPAVICEIDMAGTLLYANRRYHEFYGLRPGSAVGKRIAEAAGAAEQAEFQRRVPELREGDQMMYEREVSIRGRGPVQLEVHLVPRAGIAGGADSVYAMIVDVTARKQIEDLLQRQALTDMLTGLPNRRLLEDRIGQTIARSPRGEPAFALIYLDLDRFKPVNDQLGHAAGDELLKQAAARFRAAVRASDTVARVGGDEFVILLAPCASAADADAVAAKVLSALAQPFRLAAGAARVTCSAGVALYPRDGADADALLRVADGRMYASKRAGKRGRAGQP